MEDPLIFLQLGLALQPSKKEPCQGHAMFDRGGGGGKAKTTNPIARDPNPQTLDAKYTTCAPHTLNPKPEPYDPEPRRIDEFEKPNGRHPNDSK